MKWTTRKAYDNDDSIYHVVSGDVIVCTVHQLYADAITRCHNAELAAEQGNVSSIRSREVVQLRAQLAAAVDALEQERKRDKKDYFPFTPKDWPT